MKIGVWDSGIGGLSVFKEALLRFPYCDICYLADTKRYPYGEKTESEISDYIKEALSFFSDKNCDAVIIACSTASTVFEKEKELSSYFLKGPVVTMLNEHLTNEIDLISTTREIGIISTRLTKKVNRFSDYISSRVPDVKIFTNSAGKLVELVTIGDTQTEKTYKIADEYLKPLFKQNIDALIIGCTHFHFIMPVLKEICGSKIALIAPAPLSVEHLKNVLNYKDAFSSKREIRLFVTGAPDEFFSSAVKIGHLTCPREKYKKVELISEEKTVSTK
ncbi:MAG: glutamate racemase [Candidatus Aureabacteria bacterium]|nr:glutamate racemase [Candidatus Auribacterota bacterium]